MDWKYLLGLIGASAAWVWSVYTWHRAQAAQRTQTEFTRKELLYRELLKTLFVFYKGGSSAGTAPFLEQYRLAWLYAPDSVICHLRTLLESLKVHPGEAVMAPERKALLETERDRKGREAIAQAVAAIRADIFDTAGQKTDLNSGDFGHYS